MGTLIKFKHGAGEYGSFLSTNFNAFSTNYEPWVNTTTKQIFVDGVCLNATHTSTNDYLTIGNEVVEGGKVVTKHTLNVDSILGAGKKLTFTNGTVNATYDPNSAYTLNFGSGLKFENNTLSVNFVDSFVNNVSYADGTLTLSFNNSDIDPITADLSELVDVYNASNYITKDTSGNTPTFKHVATTTATPTDATATLAYGGTFTAYTLVETDSTVGGHVTKLQKTKFTMPAATTNTDHITVVQGGSKISVGTPETVGSTSTYTVDHEAVTAPAEITTTQTPAFGGSFKIVTGVTEDGYGHVTGLKTKDITLPTPESITNTTITGTAKADKSEAYINEDGTVTIKHVDQVAGVGSKVEWTAASNTITMDIVVIDGGTF